jgi:hypothetical protein
MWAWDGDAWQQLEPTNSPQPRSDHSLTFARTRGVIVLFGGFVQGDAGSETGEDTWEWDGTSWSQSQVTTSPGPRRRHAMAHDAASGKSVLFGGSINNDHRSDTWMWDGNEWVELAPDDSPSARHFHSIVATRAHD